MQVGAGVLAGEQPLLVGEGARGPEGLGDGKGDDERVEGWDEQQGLGAEGEVGVAVAGLDVAGGERDDLGGGLGVEQDQAGSGAVFDAGAVRIVQELTREVELLARVDVVAGVLPRDGSG